ncbi:hypothetical protein K8R43_06075 [archaeon]|nr:hypothetical protein [archaeon]
MEKGKAKEISKLIQKGRLEDAQERLDVHRGKIVEHQLLLQKSQENFISTLEEHREYVKEAENKLTESKNKLKRLKDPSERRKTNKQTNRLKEEFKHRKKGLKLLEIINTSKNIEQMKVKQEILIAKHERMIERFGLLDRWIRMESNHKVERIQHNKKLKDKRISPVERKRIMW